MLEHAKKVLKIEAEAILALVDKLDGGFARAVQLILACKGRVVVTGMGKSGHIGNKVAATLASTGTPALFLHPAEGIHGDLGMVTRGDVVIAISNSGEITARRAASSRIRASRKRRLLQNKTTPTFMNSSRSTCGTTRMMA